MERAELAQRLGGVPSHISERVLISESAPRNFMAAFASAAAGEGEVFLCDPQWGALEKAQLDTLLRAPVAKKSDLRNEEGWLMIPTGGSSGQVRFARHDATTIAAAVVGFTTHFALPQVNAVGMLPLHHVSGFMAWMRCALTGGKFLPVEWKAVENGVMPALPATVQDWVISLVPTQLERLLQNEVAVEWLRKFRIIFIGGGPAWPALLDKAADRQLPVSPGYGMTETAAMVAALRPAEFLAGERGCGRLLPHARLHITAEGAVAIAGESLFRGYYPEWRESREFITTDGAYFDRQGSLHITGRLDRVIISGGEKIDPGAVEEVLRGSGELPQVIVLGVPDVEWGEIVIAAYPEPATPNLEKVAEVMSRLLSPAKRPKFFVPLASWPVNEQGKVNRAQASLRAEEALRAGLGGQQS